MNRINISLFLKHTDLAALIAQAQHVLKMQAVARRLGLDWYEEADQGGFRDFFVEVETERLAEVLTALKGAGVKHGTVDVEDNAAEEIARNFGGLVWERV